MRILASIIVVATILCGCSSGPAWKNQAFAFAIPADPTATAASTNIVALNHVSVSPLFQGHSFTYRAGDDAYEQDPYAGFLVPPDRAIALPIRVGMRAFGQVLEPGSALTPNLGAEVTVTELYGDFRDPAKLSATLQIRFLLYDITHDGPGRVVLDTVAAHTAPMDRKTPDALMAAWDVDLREIMSQIVSDYAKANLNDGGR